MKREYSVILITNANEGKLRVLQLSQKRLTREHSECQMS